MFISPSPPISPFPFFLRLCVFSLPWLFWCHVENAGVERFLRRSSDGWGCSSPSSPDTPADPQGIGLEGGSRSRLRGRRAPRRRAGRDRAVVQETASAVRRLMDVTGVTIRVDAGTTYVIPEIGLGGRTNGTGEILIVVNPDSPAIPESLRPSSSRFSRTRCTTSCGYARGFRLPISSGHGDGRSRRPVFHRGSRHRSSDLGDALDPEELEIWSERARAQWFDSPYNHDACFRDRWGDPTVGRLLDRLRS